jgi:hypothetical protein
MQQGGSKVANAKTGVPELRPGEPRKGKRKEWEKWENEWRGTGTETGKHMAGKLYLRLVDRKLQ